MPHKSEAKHIGKLKRQLLQMIICRTTIVVVSLKSQQ